MITPPKLPNGNWVKEKIGLFGLPGVGKTHQLFTVAKWHQEQGSDAVFYGLNSDTRWEVIHANPEFENLTNLVYEDVNTFQDWMDVAKRFHRQLRPQDWLCADLLDNSWTAVTDEAARALAAEKGLDIEDMGALWSAGEPGKYPIKGWDWGMPNARYRSLANNYLVRGLGHRFLISGQAEILQPSANMKEDRVTREVREMFKHIGVKPTGQKEDPFRWNSMFHIEGDGEKAQKISTAKEAWGRRRWFGEKMSNGQVRGERFSDFFLDYLVDIAGWQIT